MKTIVTHIHPDLDAISSIWLIHRFMPGWKSADLAFVPAGETLGGGRADENPDIIHVDTGMGRFDHHQTDADTCAARLVFVHLVAANAIKNSYREALERLTNTVNDIDHFREVFLPDADSDIYELLLVNVIEGLKIRLDNDHKVVETGELLLDGLLQSFLSKVNAEAEIQKGLVFQSRWGKTLACQSDNEEVIRLAQKKGFNLVIRKGIKKGHIRIKARPIAKLNLTPLYDILKNKDQKATWFFHASGHMILNGSSKNPKSIPSTMTLAQVVQIVKRIK